MMRRLILTLGLVGFGLVLLAATPDPTPAPTPAPTPQTSPASQPQVDEVTEADLAELDHSDWSRRQAVTRQLLQNEAISLSTLVRAYHRAQSLEQRQRLMQVLEHHYLRRVIAQNFAQDQAGSLGLLQQGQLEDPLTLDRMSAVRVRNVFPGFPAFAYLQIGDLIVAVDGRPFPPEASAEELTQEMRNRIMPCPPGQRKIRLTVLREGQTLDVFLPTASMDALRNIYNSSRGELNESYRQQWDQFLQQSGISKKP